MEYLTEREALAIHNIVVNHGSPELVNAYHEALVIEASILKDGGGISAGWNGTDLSDDIKQKLDAAFGIPHLYERNLLSFDGGMMNLNTLTSELPEEVVLPHYVPEDEWDDEFDNTFSGPAI